MNINRLKKTIIQKIADAQTPEDVLNVLENSLAIVGFKIKGGYPEDWEEATAMDREC